MSAARPPSLPATCAPGTEARRRWLGDRGARVGRWSWRWWSRRRRSMRRSRGGGRNEWGPQAVGMGKGPASPENALERWPRCKTQHMLQHLLELKQCSPDLHFADADPDRAVVGDSLRMRDTHDHGAWGIRTRSRRAGEKNERTSRWKRWSHLRFNKRPSESAHSGGRKPGRGSEAKERSAAVSLSP
jgi:hypothetical protein